MKNYDFAKIFHALYRKAVAVYANGQRSAGTFFADDEAAWLTANGLSPQHLYDYAEDDAGYGEPGLAHALAIECVRRDYFLNVQGGRASTTVLGVDQMPGKGDAVRGVEWLPRLIPKAKAKLRGELPESLMYCCGGDRRFFQAHNIFPAEFLSLVWRHEHNDHAIVDWVVRRAAAVR